MFKPGRRHAQCDVWSGHAQFTLDNSICSKRGLHKLHFRLWDLRSLFWECGLHTPKESVVLVRLTYRKIYVKNNKFECGTLYI